MGRSPCREMSGVKKGPWSPEEDLLLISYVLEYGAKNWRAVRTKTGLMRCGKSCRLRWTNYLRPGIKRGNFSEDEDKLIIKLQKMLGNRWSSIASYMPERTDNDIKNYWNIHLKKKKLAKMDSSESSASTKMKGDSAAALVNKGQWEQCLQTDFHAARQAFQEALSMNNAPSSAIKPKPLPQAQLPSSTMYAFNIENIAHLLEAWMRPSASEKRSAELRSSMPPVFGGGDDMLRRHSGMTHALEGSTGTIRVEGMGDTGPEPSSSFSMLESWLLDDSMGHGNTGHINGPLADPCEFF